MTKTNSLVTVHICRVKACSDFVVAHTSECPSDFISLLWHQLLCSFIYTWWVKILWNQNPLWYCCIKAGSVILQDSCYVLLNSCTKYLLWGCYRFCVLRFSPPEQEMRCALMNGGVFGRLVLTWSRLSHRAGKWKIRGWRVNELLMPCSAHYMAYVSCWWSALTVPVSCCNTFPRTSVHSVLLLLLFFFFSPAILDITLIQAPYNIYIQR